MKSLYIVSINDAQGRMQSYNIISSTMAAAVTEACRLAGVADGTEPQTAQRSCGIHSEV